MKALLLFLAIFISLGSFAKDSVYDPFTKKKYDPAVVRGLTRNMAIAYIKNDVGLPVNEFLNAFVTANPKFKQKLIINFVDIVKDAYIANSLNKGDVSHVDMDLLKAYSFEQLGSENKELNQFFNGIEEFDAFFQNGEVSTLSPELKSILKDNLYYHENIFRYLHLFEGSDLKELIGRAITNMHNMGVTDKFIEMARIYPEEFTLEACSTIEHRVRVYGDVWSPGNKESIEVIYRHSQEVEKAEALEEAKKEYTKNVQELKEMMRSFKQAGLSEHTYCKSLNATVYDIIKNSDVFYDIDFDSIIYPKEKEVKALSSRPLDIGSCNKDTLFTRVYNSNLRARKVGVKYSFAENFAGCEVIVEIVKSPLRSKVNLTIINGDKRDSKTGSYEEIIGALE